MRGEPFYLGIDPGSLKLGWAQIDPSGTLLACGTLKLKKSQPFQERLKEIWHFVTTGFDLSTLSGVGIEGVHVRINKQTALKLQRVATTCEMALLTTIGGPVLIVQPSEWKALTGKGNASKAETLRFVNMYYGLELTKAEQDQADAILIAEHTRMACHDQSL